MTLRESILFSVVAIIIISFVMCSAVAAKPTPEVIQLYIIHQSPRLAVLSDCRPGKFVGNEAARTLKDGKHTLIIQKGICRSA